MTDQPRDASLATARIRIVPQRARVGEDQSGFVMLPWAGPAWGFAPVRPLFLSFVPASSSHSPFGGSLGLAPALAQSRHPSKPTRMLPPPWWKRFRKSVADDARNQRLARYRWAPQDWLILGGGLALAS